MMDVQPFLIGAASVQAFMAFAEPRVRKLPKVNIGVQEFLVAFLQLGSGVAYSLLTQLNLLTMLTVDPTVGMVFTGFTISVGAEAVEVIFKFLNGGVEVVRAVSFRIQAEASGIVIPAEKQKTA